MVFSKRRKRDLRYLAAGGFDRVKLPHQRMGGGDFVVAIGTNQHQVLQIRPGQEIFQQIERRRIKPLQVVQEKRQWMLRLGEDTDETAGIPARIAVSHPVAEVQRPAAGRR